MKILKSWGTDGSVVVSLLDTDPEELKVGEPVFIEFDGLPVPFFVENCIRRGGNRFVVKFEDVDSSAGAEEIVGRPVSLEEEEYEEEEQSLEGMEVIDAGTGKSVGKILEFNDFSGNACITVDYCGREVMLPLHDDLIDGVEGEKIFLRIPDGLL